jgi:hypothetical protein
MKYLLLILAVLTFSCRFGRPITAFPGGHYTNIDSVTHESFANKDFYFLCLRNGLSIGTGRISKKYNPKGQLVSNEVFKRTHAWVVDGHNRYYFRQTNYDSTGHNQRIYHRISQNHGISGSTVYEDSISFHNAKFPSH